MVAVRNRVGRSCVFLGLCIAMVAAVIGVLPTGAYAQEEDTIIQIGNVSAAPGETVTVGVSIQNNPGILGATLRIAYDEGLTLTGASNGSVFSALSLTKPGLLASPCKFTWDGVELAADDIKDGEILTLTFAVSDKAMAGSVLKVTASVDTGTVFDSNLNAIDVSCIAGSINVAQFIPGDLDGDRVVDSKDVIYARRHIVGGYAQTINVAAADVNNDMKVDSIDVVLLRRYLAGGYGIVLQRSSMSTSGNECTHALQAIAAKSPTCTDEGNIAYWRCTSCGKLFSDKLGATEIQARDTIISATGHTPVVDAAVAATRTTTGLTEGSHCSVCDAVLKAQEIVPVLSDDEYSITYDVANSDSYLAGLNIVNPNKATYSSGDSFKLKNLSVDGYQFLGWYDGAGDNATKVTHISANDADDLELYAHWKVIPYTVQYESDLFLDTSFSTYTVDKGLVLPVPKLSNYVFTGWTDGDGMLYANKIPKGTVGNITLAANWTSERNKTYTKPNPSDPIIVEDEESNVILFTYEIGRIENVPLYTIKDFGYISGDGVTREATETYSATTSQATAETISNAVFHATTDSSSWTLSSGWNESTTVTDEWCQQNGYSRSEAETIAKSDSSNWNISSGSYGSSSTSTSSVDSRGWSTDVKMDTSHSGTTTHSNTTAAQLKASLSAGFDGVGAKVEGTLSNEWSDSSSNTNVSGLSAGRNDYRNGTTESASSNTSGWNNSSSRGGSSTTSQSNTVSTAVSELICKKHGYGQTYIKSGGESSTQGLAKTQTDSSSYSSAVTYNTSTSDSVESSWTTAATKAGYHRWIVAGTAHVFGVVGYDIETKSFFVYTYSVMDDETHEFEDYSYTTAAYNDNENGVIGFEVPYDEIMDTVSNRVYASDGLKVDLETGTIMGYTGTDTLVAIPEYYNAGNGDVVKITKLSPNAFAGNTEIRTVVLSDYITDIPNGAFSGCSSLAFIEGKGVTSIGDSAFANCSSMGDCGISSKVTHLGKNAFEGADRLYANAANKDVATATIASGAKGVVLNLRFLEDNKDVLNGAVFNVPASMEYFEANGNALKGDSPFGQPRTFEGLKINSMAEETVLNKINILGTSSLPVKLASSKVTLNQSTISSPGTALALTSDSAAIGLRGTTTVSSVRANAMLCKNIRLYETASDLVGKLVVPQKLLMCGSIEGQQYLQCGSIETIDEVTFNKLLNTNLVYFDAGEGVCSEDCREITYGEAIGNLPTPTRDYCTFDGWYLKGTDTKVTETTVLPIGSDLTLVAQWKTTYTTDTPDGIYSFVASSDSRYSLDMPRRSLEPGACVQLYRTNHTFSQIFRLTRESDGSYKVTFVASDLTIEAYGKNENGWPCVRQALDSGLDTQRWYIHQTNDGWYSLRNKGNNLYFDITNGLLTSGATIQCCSANGSATQKFNLKKERYALYNIGGFSDVEHTWDAANAICEKAGGHLATITAASEQVEIEKMITDYATLGHYWLGGFREGSDWKWVTGEAFSFLNWDSDQPDNSYGRENKLVLRVRTNKWNDTEPDWSSSRDDENQSSDYGLICEWEDTNSLPQSSSGRSLLATSF